MLVFPIRRCPVSKTWLPLRTRASSTCNSDSRSKKSSPLTQRPVDDRIRPLFSTNLSYNDLKSFFCQPYCRQHICRQLVFYGTSLILRRFPDPETKKFFRKSGWTSSSGCASACSCEAEYVLAFPLTKTLTRASASLEGDLPTGSPAVHSLDFPFHSSSGIPSFVGAKIFSPLRPNRRTLLAFLFVISTLLLVSPASPSSFRRKPESRRGGSPL